MTRLELAKILNSIMMENHFTIIDRDKCHSENEMKINSMQRIFDLAEKDDLKYLCVIAELLSDNPNDVVVFLQDENKNLDLKNIHIENADKLLVATALEENIEFFSMAWNWVSFIEYKIKKNNIRKNDNKVKNYTYSIIEHIDCIAAATAGMKPFGNEDGYEIPNIGKLYIQASESDFRLVFIAQFNSIIVDSDFDLIIEFDLNNLKKHKSTTIHHEKGTEYQYSEIIENVDIRKGLDNLTVKYVVKE